MKIYNLGSLNIDYVYAVDHFVSAGETLASDGMNIFPGGKGLNQSIALARAGAQVIHGAVIGSDGGFLLETLAESGVDTGRIQRVDGSCGHAIIQVDPNGQNCILLFAGTNHRISKDYIDTFLADACAGDILVLQNEVNGLDMIFEAAYKKKMNIAFNPSPFREELKKLPLSYVKWWFCNEIEGEALFGSSDPMQIVENFVAQYPGSCLVLTLGSNGSIFADGKTLVKQPIFPTKAVDTTAAGDTFTGYFLASVTAGKTVEQALEAASRAASVTVSRKGASESIPYARELR